MDPPWGVDGCTPTYDFCVCCGVEFGYQDASLVGARRFRTDWIARGAPWSEPRERPGWWILEEQLRMIPQEYI